MTDFACRIITPDAVVYDGPARLLIVPGAEGEIGVLARHAPIIARLDVGTVRIRLEDGGQRAFATSDGYFKMQRNEATVLVYAAADADSIDAAATRAEADDARARLEKADAGDDSIDRYRAERDLLYAEKRLELGGG